MRYSLLYILILISSISCNHINVYEKQVSLPGHVWKKNQNAVIRFDIADSTHHQLYLIVRHTQLFPFNKLVVNLLLQDTAKKTLTSLLINAPLTNNKGNWNGIAMDDIYYTRVKINPPLLIKPGQYRFVLQSAMKEEELPHILNVGIALDK